jgi:hypothetical protein
MGSRLPTVAVDRKAAGRCAVWLLNVQGGLLDLTGRRRPGNQCQTIEWAATLLA